MTDHLGLDWEPDVQNPVFRSADGPISDHESATGRDLPTGAEKLFVSFSPARRNHFSTMKPSKYGN